MTRTYELQPRRLTCKESERLVAAHCRGAAKRQKARMDKVALDQAIDEVEAEALRLASGKRDLSRVERPLTKDKLLLLNAITEMRMIPMFVMEAVKKLKTVKSRTPDYRKEYIEICKRWKSVHKGRDYSDSPVIYYTVLSLLRG